MARARRAAAKGAAFDQPGAALAGLGIHGVDCNGRSKFLDALRDAFIHSRMDGGDEGTDRLPSWNQTDVDGAPRGSRTFRFPVMPGGAPAGRVENCSFVARQSRLCWPCFNAVWRMAMRQSDGESDKAKLDEAFDRLEAETPDRVARAIRWLRDPRGKWVRLPLGLLIVVASLLGPLVPFLGIEFVPLGLLLVAQDFPPLRKPVADMTLWLEDKWVAFRRRRQHR